MSFLTKYEPATLSELFDDVFSSSLFFEPRTFSRSFPEIEVREEKDHFSLVAEMPGLKKEDIKVEVKDGVLTLSGEKKHEKHEKEKGYYYSERSYGRFERSFNLGENINDKDVEAKYQDGVLQLTLKKNETAKAEPKQIPVN